MEDQEIISEHQLQYIRKKVGLSPDGTYWLKDEVQVKQPVEQLTSSKHILKLTSTIGCYYVEPATSEPWTTFEAINHSYTCLACGEQISRGFSRGAWGEEDYFCSTHIQVEVEQPGHNRT